MIERELRRSSEKLEKLCRSLKRLFTKTWADIRAFASSGVLALGVIAYYHHILRYSPSGNSFYAHAHSIMPINILPLRTAYRLGRSSSLVGSPAISVVNRFYHEKDEYLLRVYPYLTNATTA